MKILLSLLTVLLFCGQALGSDFLSSVPVYLSVKEKKALNLQKKWQAGTLAPVTTAGGKTTFVYGHSTPTIIVSPYKVADIELQPGEIINSLVLGDNERWLVEIVFSGTGGVSTSHVIIKPFDSGLETTAVITTDRRVYHVNLKSDRHNHMFYVGYLYPNVFINQARSINQKIAVAKEANTTVEGFDLANLNFKYSIEGETNFKPERVYDNGSKTYIKIPNIQELPIFLVKTSAGEGLVNYRFKDNTYIIDRLFDEAYLVVGVGDDRQEITISKLKE